MSPQTTRKIRLKDKYSRQRAVGSNLKKKWLYPKVQFLGTLFLAFCISWEKVRCKKPAFVLSWKCTRLDALDVSPNVSPNANHPSVPLGRIKCWHFLTALQKLLTCLLHGWRERWGVNSPGAASVGVISFHSADSTGCLGPSPGP